MALYAMKVIGEKDLFLAFSSDGIDNGPAAGAIVDAQTISNAAAKNLIELTGKAWEDKIVGFACAAGANSS